MTYPVKKEIAKTSFLKGMEEYSELYEKAKTNPDDFLA